MIVLGLTGSIGMGKSMASSMLEHLGVPVHDADSCVHDLLCYDSPAWASFTAAFPYFSYPQIYGKLWSWTLSRSGFSPWWRFIDRSALGRLVFQKPEEREKLEAVLHPFVRKAQNDFIRAQQKAGRSIVALDIPLLFETGAETRVDYTVSVTAPDFVQRARVMERPGMNEKKYISILQRQMPDGEKCARADFVIPSGLGRAHMMRALKEMLYRVRTESMDRQEYFKAG